MRKWTGARWAFALAALLSSSMPAAADVSAIDVPMASAADQEATGSLRFRIPWYIPGQSTQPTLSVAVSGLPSGRSFALEVNGKPEASFQTDDAGSATLELDVVVTGGTRPLLAVDPRGKLVTVTRDGTSWLAAVLSGPLEPPGIVFDETAYLVREDPFAMAAARYRRTPSGTHFDLYTLGLPEGGYAVLVDDFYGGSFRAAEDGAAWLSLSDPSFDPRNQSVEIVGLGGIVLEGVLRAQLPGSSPQPAAKPVSLSLRIPDFFSSQVLGMNVWRMDDDQADWRVVERIFFWGPYTAADGSERLDTSRIDATSGAVLPGHTDLPIVREGDAVTLSVDFERPAPAADFKVSTFNRVGESLRSQAAAHR